MLFCMSELLGFLGSMGLDMVLLKTKAERRGREGCEVDAGAREKQIPCGNDKNNSKSNSSDKSRSRSFAPLRMTMFRGV